MPSSKAARYGHVRLSFFFSHLLTVLEHGFIFRRKRYSWHDVDDIRVWQEAWPGIGHAPETMLLPRASITLKDGKHIRIRGGVLTKRSSELASGYETAFDELVALFLEKRQTVLRTQGTAL